MVDSGIRVVGVELPVGSPLVAVDDRSVPHDPLDDRNEGLCTRVRCLGCRTAQTHTGQVQELDHCGTWVFGGRVTHRSAR